ncbi:MAG TPA: hypothetical protein VF571_04675 [Pyrinomonadaceae bacterium]|jgi:hypothetical protein
MPAKYSKENDQNPSLGGENALQQNNDPGSDTPVNETVPEKIRRLLSDKPSVTVAFPSCSEELLALIKTKNVPYEEKDDITRYFDEYFRFGGEKGTRHVITKGKLGEVMDEDLLKCSVGSDVNLAADIEWISDCCLCSPCLTLDGNRNPLKEPPARTRTPLPNSPRIKRLFIGDLFWLFYFERMGVFQILGVILDSYANNGRLPISKGSLDTMDIKIKDDVIVLILEVMTRQTKMGMSSTVRDRGCSYQTSLGWVTEGARKLKLDTQVNTGFSTLFHKFIFNALEFYRDKRLAIAIQGSSAGAARPSVATLTTISDTLEILKKRFEPFDYGRNYNNTLSGIIWAIAGMAIIRDLRTTLGIPPAYNDPHEFISAAYDLLVLKRPVTSGDSNRYIVHRECAKNGRNILLDLEVLNHRDTEKDGDLEKWLEHIESKIEAYRTAYRTLTGVDLGASPNPMIEQQV